MNNVKLDPKKQLTDGVNLVYEAVKSTFGPSGKTVIIDQEDKPIITKDGITVASYVKSSNPIEQLGITLVKNASKQANDIAGDGSTTTTILTAAMLTSRERPKQGFLNYIDHYVIPLIHKAVEEVKPEEIETLTKIASNAANGDYKTGEVIAKIFSELGPTASIRVERGNMPGHSYECIRGYSMDVTMTSKFFHDMTGQSSSAVYEEAYVVTLNKRVNKIQDLQEFLVEGYPTIFLVHDIEENIVNQMIANVLRKGIQCNILKTAMLTESRRSMIDDIKTITNKLVRVELKNSQLVIYGDYECSEYKERVSHLKSVIEETQDPYREKILKERLANLEGLVAKLSIYAETDEQYGELADRVEDSINATRASLKSGILKSAAKMLDSAERSLGCNIGLGEPYRVLMESNPSYDSSKALDPYMVVTTALRKAASVADTVLSSQVVITQELND